MRTCRCPAPPQFLRPPPLVRRDVDTALDIPVGNPAAAVALDHEVATDRGHRDSARRVAEDQHVAGHLGDADSAGAVALHSDAATDVPHLDPARRIVKPHIPAYPIDFDLARSCRAPATRRRCPADPARRSCRRSRARRRFGSQYHRWNLEHRAPSRLALPERGRAAFARFRATSSRSAPASRLRRALHPPSDQRAGGSRPAARGARRRPALAPGPGPDRERQRFAESPAAAGKPQQLRARGVHCGIALGGVAAIVRGRGRNAKAGGKEQQSRGNRKNHRRTPCRDQRFSHQLALIRKTLVLGSRKSSSKSRKGRNSPGTPFPPRPCDQTKNNVEPRRYSHRSTAVRLEVAHAEVGIAEIELRPPGRHPDPPRPFPPIAPPPASRG